MDKFYFITHDNHDAYFNLASEEYLLKQTDGYYVYLWINEPAVIVGVNQNAINEVNLAYTEEKGIKVVRRLTGGGTVYHDQNNLCYTIIAPFNSQEDNYKKFTGPVIEYLNSLGVKAEFSGRNDITINGKKISGNAQTVYKNRIMHHGTILLNTDMSALEKAIKVNKLKVMSKGISSNRARVVNLLSLTKDKLTVKEFKDGLAKKLSENATTYSFSHEDVKAINKLVDEKYSRFSWNIGASPKGSNTFTHKFPFGIISFNFDTIDGKIQNASITGDFFSKKDIREFENSLNGTRMKNEDIIKAFSTIGDYIVGAEGIEIVNEMLS